MKHNILATLSVALMLAPAALQAQHPQHAAMGGAPDMVAMHCGGDMSAMHGRMGAMAGMGSTGDMMEKMMGPPTPAMILEHGKDLNLSAEQVTRLEALQKQAQPDCARHMKMAMASHLAASQMLDAASPNFDAFAAKMKEATGHMVEGQVAIARAAVAARDVLTAAQRTKLENSMSAMHRK